jgi:hypothetical protein
MRLSKTSGQEQARPASRVATMRNRIALVFGFFSFFSLVATGPAAADDRSTCAQRGHPDRIAACSRVIARSGGRDAVAFDNRGAEYGDKGDYDRAIADFSEAVRTRWHFSIAAPRCFARTRSIAPLRT